MVFSAIVNGINSLISLSAASLLLYRNAAEFRTLILYSATLLHLGISCSNFFGGVFYIEYTLSMKSESLTFSVLIWMPFIYFLLSDC